MISQKHCLSYSCYEIFLSYSKDFYKFELFSLICFNCFEQNMTREVKIPFSILSWLYFFDMEGWNPDYIPVKFLTSAYLKLTLKIDSMNVSVFLPWSEMLSCPVLRPSHKRVHFPLTAKVVHEHLTHNLSEMQGGWSRLLFWQAAQIATDAVKNILRFAVSVADDFGQVFFLTQLEFFYPWYLSQLDFLWKLPDKTWYLKRG